MSVLVNPFARWGVSQGWTQGSHVNNPAIDYPMPVGTLLLSPAAGRIRLQHWNGSRSGGNPGNKVIVDLPNGRSIHLAHLSAFHVAHGQSVGQLQDLGLSGNTGDVRPAPTRANPNSGAHLHTFGLLPNGARWNWTLDAASLASTDAKPFVPPVPVKKKLKESDMPFPIKSGSGALALLGEFSAQILEWPRDAELWAAAKFIHEMDADPAPLADEHWRMLVGAANGRRAELVKEVSGRPGEFPAGFAADVRDAARVGAKEGTGEAIDGATIRAAAT